MTSMVKIDSPFFCLLLAIFIILLWLPVLISLAIRARHPILAYIIIIMTFSLKLRRKKRLGTQNSLCSQIITRKIRTSKHSRLSLQQRRYITCFLSRKLEMKVVNILDDSCTNHMTRSFPRLTQVELKIIIFQVTSVLSDGQGLPQFSTTRTRGG